jgi:K+-transporting ATPase c subunit
VDRSVRHDETDARQRDNLTRTLSRAGRPAADFTLAPEQIAAFVAQHTTPCRLWIFGEPRVNVLELNLVLEKAFPKN